MKNVDSPQYLIWCGQWNEAEINRSFGVIVFVGFAVNNFN